MKSTRIRKFALSLAFIGSIFPPIAQAQIIIDMTYHLCRLSCYDAGPIAHVLRLDERIFQSEERLLLGRS